MVLELIIFIIFLILINFFILKNYSLLSRYINVYDIPSKRKLHSSKTPLIGGIIFFINLIFFLIFFNLEINQNYEKYNLILKNEEIYSYFTFSVIIFLIGLIDDKIDLNPYFKLFLLGLCIVIFLTLCESSLVTELRFSFFEKSIYLGNYSYFFTVLCFLLFINSCNMFDGINFQSGIYFLIFIITLMVIGVIDIFILLIVISLISFLILNSKGKVFMGDSGIFLYSFTLGFLSIKIYNLEIINNVEIIFILMMVPGIDMFRLFVVRIYDKKSPFRPDNSHIHHLLLKKFNYFKTILILCLLIIIPLVMFILGINSFIVIIIYSIFYLILLNRLNLNYVKK